MEKQSWGQRIVFALIMGWITTLIISFFLVSINVGFKGLFVTIWLRSWFLAYLFVIPTILFIAPLIQKLTTRIFNKL